MDISVVKFLNVVQDTEGKTVEEYRANLMFNISALQDAEMNAFMDAISDQDFDIGEATLDIPFDEVVPEPEVIIDKKGTNKIWPGKSPS